MEGENDVIEYDGLIYERTDDMSVLSDFCCGVFDMDDFIIGICKCGFPLVMNQ